MAEILFPVGRMIGGSVYKAQVETDRFNKPKLNADGTPKTSFSLGIAIPKTGEQHWSQTKWGAQVMAVGQQAHPNNWQHPTYAWKIKDGDSRVPNKAGRIIAEQEGCAGCWVIWFRQSWAPKLVAEKGQVTLIEPDQIVPGYYVEVYASVIGNTGDSPGVYMNPMAVNRVAFGERLSTASVDTTSVGFGSGALPAGASLTPVGGGFVPPQAAQQGFLMGAAPGMPQTSGFAQPVQPNPAFLQIPAAPIPAIPVAPAPVKQMLPKAGGASYADFTAKGWTDAMMIQQGYMAP